MVDYIAALILILLVCLAISWQKTYFVLPAKELKRRAEKGDEVAAKLWRAVALGPSLRVFIWLIIGFGAAGSFVLLGQVAPPWLAFVAISLLLWVAFAWLPRGRLSQTGVKLTVACTPVVAGVTSFFDPVFRRVAALASTRLELNRHTGIFEREDLIELLERQKDQPDSRISLEELDIAVKALKFGDLAAKNVMVPRKKVTALSADDAVSPIFLDELHKTGHSRFLVYQGKKTDFVGTLYLDRLTNVNEGKGAKGHVRDFMRPGIVYVHEKDSLAQALHAYYLTKSDMLVVINKFEDYVGLLTVDDVLHALLGKPSDYGFDRFDSRSATAAKHAKKPEPAQPEELISEQPEADDTQ